MWLEVDCPSGGCTNGLIPRRAYYDFLVGLKPGGADDIIVASILNLDAGERFESNEAGLTSWCGAAGSQGYRYELFTEMFPATQRLVSPICDRNTGQPVPFAPALAGIARTVDDKLRGGCLNEVPFVCTSDGPASGERCGMGERCCPMGQACSQGPYLAGAVNAAGELESGGAGFRLCSGFGVQVEEVLTTGREGSAMLQRLEEGLDYAVVPNDLACVQKTGSPLRLTFSTERVIPDFVVSYPRRVAP